MVFAYNADEHARIQQALTARKEAADEATKAWTQVFRLFGVDNYVMAQSPFGNAVTIDLDPDDALAMAETIIGMMDS